MKRLLLKHRRAAAEAIHGVLVAAALAASFLLRFEFTIEPVYAKMLAASLPIMLLAKLGVFRAFGLRDLAWRYLGFQDLMRIAAANVAGSAAATVLVRLMVGGSFPRSIHIIDLLVCLALMVAVRSVARICFDFRRFDPRGGERLPVTRIVIYGAGQAGVALLGEIQANPQSGYRVMGFLDDDPQKRNLRLRGVRVLGARSEIPAAARKHRVKEILLAMPAATGSQITAILESCHAAGLAAKRAPVRAGLADHSVLVDPIRDIRLEDLLGRPEVRLEENAIRNSLTGRVVLVTGAGGSIGSELCRQIARYQPAALIGFDNAETALYQIDQEMRERLPETAFVPEVGSIQNRCRLEEIFREHRPESVYHAAAYKHVPMMEAHLFEAVENNVFGTRNVAWAAAEFEADDFVLVSSDKAVRPANVMGATKRLAELVCLAAGSTGQTTRFMAVRFGNVLGSNGSVIPLFQRQIAAGGPITVTHPEMRRFFMTIAEAAQLVLQAAAMGLGGEVFVLDMGEPVRIVDLANKLILLSGLKPEDIRIEFSGIRPGEKLYEELNVMEEDTSPTLHTQVRIFAGAPVPAERLKRSLDDLRRCVESRDAGNLVVSLKKLVPDYSPSSLVLRRAFKDRSLEMLATATTGLSRSTAGLR